MYVRGTMKITFLLPLLILLSCSMLQAQQQKEQLYAGQFAPSFSVKDVDGKFHSIEQYKGQKILLSFYRNAGCPVSNYLFHELEQQKDYFSGKNVVLLSVYESAPENVKAFRDTNQYYQILLPNPGGSLYDLYGVEISRAKMTKGTLHGAMQKSKEGKKMFGTQKIKQDGQPNRIAADFIIDENGNVIAAYYGKYLGDKMPLPLIKKYID